MNTSTTSELLDPTLDCDVQDHAVKDHLRWLFQEIQVTFARVSALSVADAVQARAAIAEIAALQEKVASFKRASAALRKLLPAQPVSQFVQ